MKKLNPSEVNNRLKIVYMGLLAVMGTEPAPFQYSIGSLLTLLFSFELVLVKLSLKAS